VESRNSGIARAESRKPTLENSTSAVARSTRNKLLTCRINVSEDEVSRRDRYAGFVSHKEQLLRLLSVCFAGFTGPAPSDWSIKVDPNQSSVRLTLFGFKYAVIPCIIGSKVIDDRSSVLTKSCCR
jgi:hypothetical protein